MGKKIFVIIILSIGLGAFLFLRPYFFKNKAYPALVDRLPEGDYLGKAYLLDLARETSGMMYYHKLPFRDFFSYEFLLGQAKMYGLNLQDPIYYYANNNGNWGALARVTDSSKIGAGIERLRKLSSIKDTIIEDVKVYKNDELKMYLYYDKFFIFIYKGTQFKNHFQRVYHAKKGDCSDGWRKFLREKQFKDEKLVLYFNTSKLNEFGLDKAIFAHNSDSTSFKLLSYVKNKKSFNFSLKKDGLEFAESAFKTKQLNLHFDIAKLRNNPDDPLYKLIVSMGKKISFPTREFLEAWEGDLSFKQGGFQTMNETYVTTEMDENFNITEVVKSRDVKIPGFSLYLNMNKKSKVFINRLFAKGIMRKEGNKLYFLFSPPLKMVQKKDQFFFYAGGGLPKMITSNTNNGFWKYRGTLVDFHIDSLNQYEAFGSLHFPVDKLIQRSKFF